MHDVVKVALNHEIKFLTKDAFCLALGEDIINNTCTLREIERFEVLNATDMEVYRREEVPNMGQEDNYMLPVDGPKGSEQRASGRTAGYIAKRLEKEIHRTFWKSGQLRDGRQIDRLAWMTQRANESASIKKLHNPFLAKAI